MFSNYPGSSPSSYRADDSFLQRATLEGRATLSGAPPAPDAEETRGRASTSNGLRVSGSSVYSVGGTRLSPTRELDTPVTSDGEDEVDDVDADEIPAPYIGAPQVPTAYSSPSIPTNVVATEATPLLSRRISGTALAAAAEGVVLKQEVKVGASTAIRQEVGTLVGYMIPICGTHFLEYSLLVVTVVSVGHLGTVELAAASLANISSNVVALSVIQGACTALDTLCPQAYTSKPKDTSLYALRTYFLLVLLFIPQLIIFFNSEAILLALRQDPRVAERAATYLKILSIGLPGYGGFECVRRWLQAQGLMLAPVIALLVAAPLNVALNWLLVWGPDSIRIGFVGAPLATAISMNVMFLVSAIYAIHSAPRDAWGGFSWKIFSDLGINVRLGLAGTLMVASEWWCWEIVGLASSFLGPTTLAAQSILLTSASLFYQIPYALSVAGAVRVGNLLGAQRPQRARTASRVAMGIAVVVAGINSLLLFFCRNRWGKLFSSEPEVIEVVASVLPLVALFQLTDGVSGATGGLLRGAGRAVMGAAINLTSYYVFGLPIGLFCAFYGPKLGLQGLWMGLAIALTFTAMLSSAFIWKLDWEEETRRTVVRMGLVKRDTVEEV